MNASRYLNTKVLPVTIEGEHTRAIRVTANGHTVWLPKSRVTISRQADGATAVIASEWYLKSVGLIDSADDNERERLTGDLMRLASATRNDKQRKALRVVVNALADFIRGLKR